ncbi:unnamed protein product [Urochloa humidicola]
MEKAAGEDKIVEEREAALPPRPRGPALGKRKRADADGVTPSANLCDDVVSNIFARLPARAAVACTALSKHHRRLIRCPEFTSLHRRLAPPLPSPHIAYLATAPIRRRPEQKKPVSVFHAFHVAGGIGGAGAGAPIRSLAGRRYLGMSYINTCNGVVLLARKKSSCPCRCVLWNPAVADGGVTEVTVPDPWKASDYQILGLGYGRRNETYKLLLCCKDGNIHHRSRSKYSLAVCSLGDVEDKEPTILSTELSAGTDGKIRQESVYADGKIYLLDTDKKAILAFDVDDEAVTSIGLPIGDGKRRNPYFSKLMELSGRPCVALEGDGDESRSNALWLLSPDHQWVRRCLIAEQRYEHTIHLCSLMGIWDFGDVIVLHSEGFGYDDLFVYNATTGQMSSKATMHRDLAPDQSEYAICWGYRPTLVSPGSIIGNMQSQEEVDQRRRELPADMVKALQLVAERDGKKGHKATLDTVCFMNILVGIMQRLPDGDVQGLLELLTGDPKGLSSSEDAAYSDSDEES